MTHGTSLGVSKDPTGSGPGIVPAPGEESNPTNTLQGRMGVPAIVATVFAFLAPLSATAGYIDINISSGAGPGVPLAMLIAMTIILVFAVGFCTMGRYMPNPGAFYSYITAGLSRPIGLGGSFLAIASYVGTTLGFYAFFGIVANSVVVSQFQGPDLPWWVFAAVLWVFVSVLGYLKIDLSAKVLGVLVVLEILVVLVFDIGAIADGGPEGLSVAPFTFDALAAGPSLSFGLLFAFLLFTGFEGTAAYREEVRHPERTIPRATYIAVAVIGVFYAITSWCMIIFTGPTNATAAASEDAAGLFGAAMVHNVGQTALDISSILLLTSIAASMLSLHNLESRYVYSLGVDGILPQRLGVSHAKHGSPHVASVAVSAAVFVCEIPVIASGLDPVSWYAWTAGAGAVGLIILYTLTSASVVVYFRRNPLTGSHWWQTTVAPIIATIVLGGVLVMAITNYGDLIGGDAGLSLAFQLVTYGLLAAGIVTALILRKTKPDVYRKIGRQ
jgi:amino acid transporter